MINNKLPNIFCCPNCRQDIEQSGDFFRCPDCLKEYKIIDGIPVFLTKKKEEFDIELAFNKWHRFYENFDWEKERGKYEALNLPYIYQHFDFPKKGTLFLELGAGPSFLSFDMAKKGIKVFCVDFDFDILKIAKEYFQKHKIDGIFVCADILNLPFKSNVFDFSFGGGVIEHSKNLEKSVRGIFRVTKINGYTFQTVPMLSFFTFFFNLRYGTIPHWPVLKQIFYFIHIKILRARHMKYGYEESFTTGFLQKIFKKSGFCNIKTGFYDYNQTVFKKNKFLSKIFYKILRGKFFGDVAFIKAYK